MSHNNRRVFLKQATALAGAFGATSMFNHAHAESFAKASARVAHLTPQQVAADEDYWATIQQAYTVNPGIINLNNGGVSPAPAVVQRALDNIMHFATKGPRTLCGAYWIWAGNHCARNWLHSAVACPMK
jgi:hypothetical protein